MPLNRLNKWIPATQWLPGYSFPTFKNDLNAGLTVGVMLIPQGMAYALLAGLPPIHGLYASVLPLILYAFLGTSRQLGIGPVAMVSLMVAASLAPFANGDTATYILLASALALLSGLILIGMGLLRLGFLVNYISKPVITGFTAAAAIIIGISQLPSALGLEISARGTLFNSLTVLFPALSEIHLLTFLITIASALIIWGLAKINKNLPGALIAVILGIVLAWWFNLTAYGVKIVGEIPSGLPSFSLSGIEYIFSTELLFAAIAISLVGFTETMAVAKVIQNRHKNYTIDPNQELVALGSANLGAGIMQGFPVTGGFSRTAVNDQSGAKTGVSAIISALMVIVTLLFLTPIFKFLPVAVLAAIIIVAIIKLIHVHEILNFWNIRKADFIMLAITFVVTLAIGIIEGIGFGVVMSILYALHRSSRPNIAVLGKLPDSGLYRNINRYEDAKQEPEKLILRFDEQLYFANANTFEEVIQAYTSGKGENLREVIIECSGMNYLDTTGLEVLENTAEDLNNRGISLTLCSLKGPVRDILNKSSFFQKHNFVKTLDRL